MWGWLQPVNNSPLLTLVDAYAHLQVLKPHFKRFKRFFQLTVGQAKVDSGGNVTWRLCGNWNANPIGVRTVITIFSKSAVRSILQQPAHQLRQHAFPMADSVLVVTLRQCRISAIFKPREFLPVRNRCAPAMIAARTSPCIILLAKT